MKGLNGVMSGYDVLLLLFIFLYLYHVIYYDCNIPACCCAVHKKCHVKVLHKCPGNAKDSRETKMMTERMGINIPHRLGGGVTHSLVHERICGYVNMSVNMFCNGLKQLKERRISL